jgi:histidine kinase 2/3/4 (cytokinin receptor)
VSELRKKELEMAGGRESMASVNARSSWDAAAGLWLMTITCRSWNPLRSAVVRTICALSAWLLVLAVAIVLYRNSLSNKRQQVLLQCDNRREMFMSEVENNLAASFVILGLVASVPNLQQSIWQNFTSQTLFLRPHVQSLVYCLEVSNDERAAVEAKYNATIYTYGPSGTGPKIPQVNQSEYAPVILESAMNESIFMLDIAGYSIFQSALFSSRDSGNFTLSPPYAISETWRMGAFLPFYGDYNSSTLTTVNSRRQDDTGYIVTVLNVEEVFGEVMNRFSDGLGTSASMLVGASLDLNTYYNCSPTADPCEVFFYGNKPKGGNSDTTVVPFSYGAQSFQLHCSYLGNVRLYALKNIIAWPLLMSMVVVFCTVAVYLVVKRMQTIEGVVVLMEKMNADLREAKSTAEEADKAKSSFLATVSHEIR